MKRQENESVDVAFSGHVQLSGVLSGRVREKLAWDRILVQGVVSEDRFKMGLTAAPAVVKGHQRVDCSLINTAKSRGGEEAAEYHLRGRFRACGADFAQTIRK